MSIVAGTTRKNTCNNVIGLVKSNTMDPPTPLEYGAPPNQSGVVKAPSMPLGVELLPTLLDFEVNYG